MAYDVAPMSDVFGACYQVLVDELRLIHYRELTELALIRLGLAKERVNWERQIEDVREKMLLAGQFGTVYAPKPYCVAGLKRWFETPQLLLLKPTEGLEIRIAANVDCAIQSAFEVAMRSPYMIVKSHAYQTPMRKHFLQYTERPPISPPEMQKIEDLCLGRARGLVAEQYMRTYFLERFPEFYEDAQNYRQWGQWCDHDFVLKVNGRNYHIDVSVEKLRGGFGNPGKGKKQTDFHLLCKLEPQAVRWISVVAKTDYRGDINPERIGLTPERMIVWLNSVKHHMPFDAIRGVLRQNQN